MLNSFFFIYAFYVNFITNCVFDGFYLENEDKLIEEKNEEISNRLALNTVFIYEGIIYLSYICLCIFFSKKYSIMVIHNNYTQIAQIKLYNVFMFFAMNYSLEQYTIMSRLAWLFTSPLILEGFSNFTRENIRYTIILECILHLMNMYDIKYRFERNPYIPLTVIMYLVFLGNLTMIYNTNTPYKYGIIVGWTSIAITETGNYFGLFSPIMYAIFLTINDIIIKGFFYGLYVCNEMILCMSKRSLSFEDLKILSKINVNVDNRNNVMMQLIKFHVTSLLEHRDVIDNSKIEMSERVYCRHFSPDFIKRIVRNNSVEVNNVFIMFSDIVKYSTLCTNKHHSEILLLLDNLYNMYDKELEEHNSLQKIESIGDCYFVTSLLDTSKYSLKYKNKYAVLEELMQFSKKIIAIAKSNDISIRVGVHVGTVSVGIIGHDIPRFAVVGNNVNIAARLESTCEEYCIQISKEVYSLIHENDKNKNNYTHNVLNLKNIGSYDCYTRQPSIDQCNTDVDVD